MKPQLELMPFFFFFFSFEKIFDKKGKYGCRT